MEGYRYKNPPIQEVICEIVLDESTPWDLAIPGIIYERLKEHFPLREKRRVQEVNLDSALSGTTLTVRDTERAVFLTEGRKSFIQIGDRLLAINQLPPYPGWESFKRAISVAYKALNEAVTVKNILVLLLRYLDRIEIPAIGVRIEDYFLFRPHFEGVQERSPLDSYETFIVSIQVPFEDGKNRLRIQLALRPARRDEKDKTTFILETNYICSGPMEPNELDGWLDVAHDRIIDTFEKAITDKLRALFKPE